MLYDMIMERVLTWARIISAPASARPNAIACPSPRVAPVHMAVFPSRENRERTPVMMEAAVCTAHCY